MAQRVFLLSIFFVLIFIELCAADKLKLASKRIKRWNIENWNRGTPPSNWGYNGAQNPPPRPNYNVHVHIHHAPDQEFYQPPSQQYNNQEDYERGFHHGFSHGLSYLKMLPQATIDGHNHHNPVFVMNERDDGYRPGGGGNMNPIPLNLNEKLKTTTEKYWSHILPNSKKNEPLKLNGKPKTSPEIENNKKTEVKEETKPKTTKNPVDNINRILINKTLTPITNIKKPSTTEKVIMKESEKNNKTQVLSLQDVYLNTKLPSEDPCEDYDPMWPDFNAPGKGYFETLCKDFIWEARRNELREYRAAACKKNKEIAEGLYTSEFRGDDDDISEFPHMGAIGWKAIDDTDGLWVFKCGCTLISYKFVLTTAHCTHIPVDSTIAEPDPKIVRLGSQNIIEKNSDGKSDFKIINIVVANHYRAPKKYDDVAVMELEKEVEFSTRIRPACLWTTTFLANELPHKPKTVTGWGAVESAKKITTPKIKVTELDVIDLDDCDKLVKSSCTRDFCKLRGTQICGRNLTSGGINTCPGDSGGAFQVELDLPKHMSGKMYHVFGVNSFGFRCGEPNTPVVFSRVFLWADWIVEVIEPREISIKDALDNIAANIRKNLLNQIRLEGNKKLETTTENYMSHILPNVTEQTETTKNPDDDNINQTTTLITDMGNSSITEKVIVKEPEENIRDKFIRLEDVYLNTELPSEDPCEEFDPKWPDFYAPGIAFFERTCRNHIWMARRNELQVSRAAACKKKKGGIVSSSGIERDDAKISDFPHMGAIGWKAIYDTDGLWVFKCGCTLISNKIVLTAAHCTHVPVDSTIAEPDPKIVRLGSQNIIDKNSDGKSDFKIMRTVVADDYQAPKKYNDVAIMELEQPVEFSMRIRPACLWTSSETNELPSNPKTVTGWGAVESAKKITTPKIEVSELDVIEVDDCGELVKSSCTTDFCEIKGTQICGGNRTGGINTCPGDSGGAFQVELDLPKDMSGKMYYVFGVNSFGFGCGEPNTPVVFSRVSLWADWVEKVIKGTGPPRITNLTAFLNRIYAFKP
ncbi:uncharacterized protein LOC119693151 isoform X2 [Plutella xylostella]|uniref:uncharacterized protein LOC119693151 isoform X2 n=1 Tax=Plutella xylostella TaxID=51655 RepID=UPI0020327FC2|nr:uncharacterized protein LOC119693151 isoform X2 [Plutella xylostella]